jgi:Zn-dependent protease
VGPSLLACPACHRLVHADELTRLAADAAKAAEPADALAKWRRALELLPPASEQSKTIGARVVALSDQISRTPGARAAAEPAGTSLAARAGALGALALLAWKFKAAIAFALTKGKFLLAGLTKLPTLFSMLLSLGVYWAAWGWAFALGLLVSLYVHEMGHVAALRRYGIRATAPMFVPGLGAYVRMDQYPATGSEDARVGLAGPIYGLGAALAALAIHFATGSAYWAAIARVGAWLNLFNLLPLWQLDGGRGFRALSRGQRVIALVVLLVAWVATHEGLLLLLALGAGLRVFSAADAPAEGDDVALVQYGGLVAVLAGLSRLPVAMP